MQKIDRQKPGRQGDTHSQRQRVPNTERERETDTKIDRVDAESSQKKISQQAIID